MNKQPLVSVIVTTRNNEDTIDACLQSIKEQSYKNIELIVVDNNSTDTTTDFAKLYTKNVYTKGPERSAQRNFAVNNSKGEYVLIIDSDMELGADVVRQCVEVVSPSEQAVIIPEESFGIGFWAQCKALERSYYNGVDWIEAPRFFAKDLYVNVGGYDEEIVGGEDWDLHSRIRKQTKVVRIKAFIRHNEGALTLKEIIDSRKRYATGFTKMYSKPATQSKGKVAQVLGVYGLFLKNPLKLFRKPIVGFGTLFMKTAEFGVIAAHTISLVDETRVSKN